MRKAEIFIQDILAAILIEHSPTDYDITYVNDYSGLPISLTMPPDKKLYKFNCFPPFFDGLLPEGILLESLLKQKKIDRNNYFSQLMTVGKELVGVVTVREIT